MIKHLKIVFFTTSIALSIMTMPAFAQETSADFSGGSMLVGEDTRSCDGTTEGNLRYAPGIEDTTLAGHWLFDENAGTTTADSSGSGNNGAFYPSYEPAWIAGVSGSALEFDGTGNLSQVSHSSTIDITGNLTIAFWLYNYNTSAAGWDVVGKTDGSLVTDRWQYSVQTVGDEIAFFYCHGASSQCAPTNYNAIKTTSANIVQDQWTHVVVTYDDAGNDIQIYVDGTAEALTVDVGDPENRSIVSNTEPLRIGWSGYGGSEPDGRIDELRIYNRTLDATDAAALYNGTPTSGGPSGPGDIEYCNGTIWTDF